MISADGIFKNYGKIRALNNASMHVKEGTIHGLIGPNGAGKSTILKIMSTLVRADRGEINIGNIPHEKGNDIRRLIGVVPENPRLHEYLTAQQEITAYARLSGMSGNKISSHVKSLLEVMDLGAMQHQKISRYSTGMKKRVALAMALVTDPPVLLLDEPMSGLDPMVRRQFKDIILRLEGRTIVVSDHDLYTVEELCHSVTILKEGRTLIEDDIDALRKKIGKVSVEIKPRDANQINLLADELRHLDCVTSIEIDKNMIIASAVNPDTDIPEVIRRASLCADIIEAKPSKISLEEMFIKLAAIGDEA